MEAQGRASPERGGKEEEDALLGVTGGKLRYDAIAMLSARRISLFVFCAGTFPGIRPFFALRSENYGRKLPILPLLGNLEIGMSRIFHNWKALPYLN